MTVSPGDGGAGEVDLIAAALRADTTDLDVYANVLTGSLSEALPDGMVAVERDRSLSDRLAGRPGTVRSITVTAGGTELRLATGRGAPVATVRTRVRGVTISSKEVGVDEWVRRLAEALQQEAQRSANAREALRGLVEGR